MKYRELQAKGEDTLKAAGIDEYEIDAYELLEYVTGMSKTDYLLRKMEEVPAEEAERYKGLINERASHKPLQYITGKAYFCGHEFYVDSNVLIPRFDTEVLVEQVLLHLPEKKSLRVLDMCTGSGCIAISVELGIKERHPDIDVEVFGADISPSAVDIALKNNELNRANVRFLVSDLFDKIQGKYDIILSNPPYIRKGDIEGLMPEVKDFEPMSALDGTEDGLYFYREITKAAVRYLNEEGLLFYEIGFDQGEDVMKIMKNKGFTDIQIIKDLAGLDRVIRAKLEIEGL